MTDFSVMRGNMVDGQILPNRVTDPRLIDAMLTLPRELFVSEKHRSIAYVDEEEGELVLNLEYLTKEKDKVT